MGVQILREVVAVVEHSGRKTVCVTDIIFILNRVSSWKILGIQG
jgi:histone H4